MSTELVRGEVVPELPELVETANREHALFEDGFRQSVAHALAAGEALRQAKVQVGHGGWLSWVEEHFQGSHDKATRYMNLEANYARVRNLDASGLSLRALDKRIARINREEQAEQRRSEGVAEVSSIGSVEIRHGDLREKLHDLNGQVDAIITDPPYPAEFIEEFDALGRAAARLLKPGGILAAMVGQAHLPAYIERLCRHLPYRWCGAYLTEGPATRIHGRKVGTKWKPVLLFGGERFLTQDVFASRGDDKAHHHWGQSESGFADLIERLTEPGDLVVDPFLGGGTTAIVCQQLGRRFVGCDIDGDAVEVTRERLAA